MPHSDQPLSLTPASRNLSQRGFLGGAPVALVGTSAAAASSRAAPQAYQGKICYFSKALQTVMDWRRLAQLTKSIGFDALDLTVRKGGHVAPERAAEDLPKAVAALREAGVEVPMITTALTSASDPTARPILSTASKLEIHYFKAGYYYYQFKDVRGELAEAGRQFRSLAELAKQYGIQAGYHNHSEYIGAALWDAAQFLEPLDPRWVGYYLDTCHATGEGGVGAWKSALHLAASRVKMVAVKDFYWKTTPKGWEYTVCPLGQGRVDLKYFFKVLAQGHFQGPISLHVEYEPEGSSLVEKEANTIVNSARDLALLRALVHEAYESSDK
jgi:sugar phosphate isomerase/epimerase